MSANTYSIPVSGPSRSLAYLRALWLRATATANTAWTTVRGTSTLLFRVGSAAAETGLAVLSSDLGYRAATAFARGAVTAAWSGIGKVVGDIGSGLAWSGRTANRAVAAVSPRAAARLHRIAQPVSRHVEAAWRRTDTAARGVGEVAWYLVHAPLVQRSTTLAAQAASMALVLHALSKGTIATRVTSALPRTVDLIAAVTNPTMALAGVLGVTAVAMGVALLRLLARPAQEPEHDPAGEQACTEQTADANGSNGAAEAEDDDGFDSIVQPLRVAEVMIDLEAIAATVRVAVKPDGSVIVHGIPDTVPHDLGQVVAEIARNAVEHHLRRVLPVRPTPSRDDRRLFTKAAREAIVAEARRRQRESAQAA